MQPTYEKARIINDDFRDAALNRRYYSCLLSRAKQNNLILEIIVALGTSGAIAAWNVWREGPGAYIWKALAAIATVVAVIKPFLNLPKEIERYSELVAGWASLFYDLKQVTVDLRASGALSDPVWSAYSGTRQRMKDLGVKDDPVVKRRLQRRCFEQVKREIPADTLWWPEEETSGRPGQNPEATAFATRSPEGDRQAAPS